jgi:hypothetical protein
MESKVLSLKAVIMFVALIVFSACSSQSQSNDLLPGANLVNAELQGQDLTGIDLSGANLTGANLSSANLTSSNLRGANLTQANLAGTNFTNADLSGANLTGVIVEGANFSNTSMDGATMNSDSFYGLIGIPTTTVAPATTTTQTPQPQVVDSPTQTTSKPIYIVRTEVRTVAKTLPNGPWTCERTYIYSDGNRTRENFKSESLCSD